MVWSLSGGRQELSCAQGPFSPTHGHSRAVPKAVLERIVALRKKTRYGPRRLAYYLNQEGISVSVYGTYRVLQRAGMEQKRRSRPRKKPQSYAMAVPGQRVQIDVLPT